VDDAFKLLDLPDTATCEQVRKAYLKKAEISHPDKGGAQAEFVKVGAAYRYAMSMCTKPIPCEECGEVGFIERAAGWRVARIVCPKCGGQGTTPR
jgi:DnaJ-class molecular chaperone